MIIKKFNDMINEDFFDDVVRPMFDPYIMPGTFNKNEYNGQIVDKRIVDKMLGGEKFVVYVRIPGRGVEKFTVSSSEYYNCEIGDNINVEIEE